MYDTEALRGWIPSTIDRSSDPLLCRWLYTGQHRFTEPFFSDTIAQCKLLPQNRSGRKVCSSLDMVREWCGPGSAPPAAFIFHVSRCGSTLLSQLLALLPDNNVLSEVPFFDEALRLPYQDRGIGQEESASLFEAAIRWYSRPDLKTFIKTDSWHILFYPLIRRLYPATPVILLYRAPQAVLRSQQNKRGIHAVPGLVEPALFGWNRDETLSTPFDEHLRKVLETYYTAFIDAARADDVLLVNYSEGMEKIMYRVASHVGLALTDEARTQIAERCRYHGKYPDQAFSESATMPVLPASWARCLELYEQLEGIRTSAQLQPQKLR